MCKKTLLLTAALVSSFGAVAQALPEGTTSLLPAGVIANIGQEKMFIKQKNLCVAGSPSKGYKAYFSATDAVHGEELWVTDGTPTGTRMVKDINPGVSSSEIQWLTRFNDKVVFSAKDDEDNGSELWISDGTEEGTKMIKDIHEFDSSNPIAFCQMDETHFVFFATDSESEFAASTPQRWLWISDGTEEGTKLVKAVDCIYPGVEDGDHRYGSIMRVGRKVFFKGNESDKNGVTHGEELWVTDGTEAGTYLVKDINIEPDKAKGDGQSTLNPALCHLQNFYNEKVFFKAWSLESGNEPWASDGTEEGTYEIFNTNPAKNANGLGEGGGATMVGDPYNGYIVFRSISPTIGNELAWTNCEKGNIGWKDINLIPTTETHGSAPDNGVVFDGVYIFCANTGTDATIETCYGGELHCFDGENVWMQDDYAPGAKGCNWAKELTVAGGSLYWWNEGSLDGTGETNTKLHRLDSKDGKATIVSNIDASGDKVYSLRNLNGDLLYTSSITKQLYCYHYRQSGYDPEKNPDVMEPEYRTRKEIEESTAIEGVFADNNTVISVSPNPASVYFTVNVDVPVKSVRIYNPAGTLVKTVANPDKNTVQVSDMASGLYMLSIETEESNYSSKLIVK